MDDEKLVVIEQALPQRVRLSAPRLSWHREVCARVARALAEDGTPARVTVRPATGSVILEGEEGALAASRFASRLEALLREERDEEGRLLTELRQEDHPGPTRIARAVVRAAAEINADVRRALDERADLGTILPVIFAIAGVAEVSRTGKMPGPSWFNLLWWSMRSFMTFNIRAVEEEVEDGAAEPAPDLHQIVGGL